MNADTKVTFLGGGNMAGAQIQGLLRHGVAASQLSVAEPIAIQRARLQAEFGIVAVAQNDVAARGAAMVVLAVKPRQALGGTTAAAWEALAIGGFDKLVAAAVGAAAARGAELAELGGRRE